MNADQDRPYVCSAPGCSQRFQREDHLMIHRHKHEMTLNFPSIKGDNVLSDQTPTPTRFLRNCEEVGLFSDLELSQSQDEGAARQRERQLMMHSNMIAIPGPSHSAAGSSHQSKTISSHSHPSIPNGYRDSLGNVVDVMSPQQQGRAGQHLLHMQAPPTYAYQHHSHGQSHRSHPHSHQSGANPHPCDVQHSPPAHYEPRPSHCSSPLPPQPRPAETTGGGVRRRRTADEDPDERRRKFLERNRAAATRCRQKRKVWVMSLERKAEELTHTNLQLQNEVTSLRSEVTQLKQILLTHKDCPVTARQREIQGSLTVTGSPAHHTVQHNSITTSSSTSTHTLAGDVYGAA
ncbi:cyclic AMP-responsive element-binding protein 5 [Chanos chanos]|uniref:Cyclic AMP-responsive element-binding protein 5 n=1 Tax=Chanos chanos TaxID=29144 RepID=A0A6J2WJB5_CHACN|nr:cyclic AMP-responsive element-binding protein 5-like [Chanos chanos]